MRKTLQVIATATSIAACPLIATAQPGADGPASAPALFAASHGWRVTLNEQAASCTATSPANAQATSLVIGWNYAQSEWWLVLSNPQWKLKVGNEIPARVFVDRDLLTSEAFRVLTPSAIALPIPKQDRELGQRAMSELAAGRQLNVHWSGGSISRADLTGSRWALATVERCADRVKGLVSASRTAPAGSKTSPSVAGYRRVAPRP